MTGLIPQRFIDDLLSRIDIVDVIGARLSLKKTGKNYSACCPFHKEKTPSFSVNPEKQFYYCFGCCAGGNALRFVMDYDQLEFPEAVEALARDVGLEVPREESTHARSNGSSYKAPAESPLYALLAQAAALYQTALKSHPARTKTVEYLKARGVSGRIARDFGVGFAPPGWDTVLRELGQQDAAREKQLIEAGLVIDNPDNGRRYDRFRERIMFPIRDTRGRVIAFGGRVLGDEKPKYLNSPETPVFHKGQSLYGLYEVRRHNRDVEEIMVVEGYMDVIALAQQGFTNAVATLGTATSEEHIRLIFRSVSSILFCFDGDTAGRAAAWRALEACLTQMQDGRRVRFLFLPEGEDPDSLVRREGNDAFRARIAREAEPLADYFFRHLAEHADLGSLEGKAQVASLAKPLLAKLPASHFCTLMQQQLDQLTGLASVPARAAEAPVKPARVASVARTSAPTRTEVETPLAGALRSLLYRPSLATLIESPDDAVRLAGNDAHATLFVEVVALIKQLPESDTMSLLAHWHGTAQGAFLRQLLEKEWLIDDASLEQQFSDTITVLTARAQESNLESLLKKHHQGDLEREEMELLRRLLQRAGTEYRR